MADDRQVTLSGPLADPFNVIRVSGEEALGRLYEITVDLLSRDSDVDFGEVLGQPLGVRIALPGGGERFFHGLVTRFGQTGGEGRYAAYRAVLRPWAWYLSRASDCRIFQEMTIPDIVKAVFREHGFSDFEESLSGDYSAHTYCVQYRETDFNFVCRLLEEEGITFFFRHEQDRHILVLADGLSAYSTLAGYEQIPYYPPGNEARRERDHISEWLLDQEIQTELYALRDYDFEKPKANLDAKASIQRSHGAESFEIYDYPGYYKEKSDGEILAEVRIEEQQARFETLHGQGDARGIAPGFLFSLTNHPRPDQNREVLVTQARYEVDAGQYETAGGSGAVSMHCAFTAVPSDQAYRPARATPKPVVQGPHTATVVGPAGETVWTDQYGRVKVQFHWDREGKRDENSSCWLRVSQMSAGKNWGAMFVPHVGHEVIVSFLEGDPDQPIITGRVYNADNMPPLPLPDDRYKSIVRDHYGNEIRMDGTPGEEHISIYSPTHKSKMWLGRSYKRISESDEWSKTYGDKWSVQVGNKLISTLGLTNSITVGNALSLTVGASETVKASTDLSLFVGAKWNCSIGPEFNYLVSPKFTWGYSVDIKKTEGDYRRTSTSDIILDSDKDVILAGGKSDNTLLTSNDEELSLSYGSDPGNSARTASDLKVDGDAKYAAGMAAAGIATAVGSALMQRSTMEQNETVDADSGDTVSFEHTAPIMATMGSINAVIGFGVFLGSLGSVKSDRDTPPPRHSTSSAKVTLKKELVEVHAGSGQESKMTIKPRRIRSDVPDGAFDIRVKHFKVNQNMLKVDKVAKKFSVKAKIDHKNLKVT